MVGLWTPVLISLTQADKCQVYFRSFIYVCVYVYSYMELCSAI